MAVESVNHVLAFLTVLSLFSLLLLFAKPVRGFVANWGLQIGFGVALGGMLLSLYYSNIVGYAPCLLCWYQRIFLYPEVFILGIALWKRDGGVRLYGLVLSALGGLIALYHVLLEHGVTGGAPCPANGPSCLTRYVYEYGFVTIPVMSLTAFLLIFIALYFYKRESR